MEKLEKIPKHIAIIMDGNGRWAKMHNFSRVRGHREGAKVVRLICEECARIGVKELTLYTFSSENWKRPMPEINALMRLLKIYLVKERKTIMKNNIRFTTIGRIEELPEQIIKEINYIKNLSSKNTGMILRLALNYSGRLEIIDGIKNILKNSDGIDLNNADENFFKKFLYEPEMSEPDLLIRTGGDYRISNFLLWHIPYAELWFTPVYWPDFSVELLWEAIKDFSKRERRFGAVGDERERERLN